MKKYIMLSALSLVTSAILLGDDSQAYQILKGAFVSSAESNFSDGNITLYGTIGQVAVHQFDGNYSGGFWVAPEELNNYPEINISTNISISEDNSQNITFTYIDVELDEVNTTLIQNPKNGQFAINGRTFTYTPNSNFNGSDLIGLQFNDGFGGIIERNLSIVVGAVDDLPYLSGISNISTEEDSSSKTISLSLSDIDSNINSATYSVNISDNTLADVSISGTNLIVTPKADKFGSATISVIATLDGKTAQQNFNYTLNSVDDNPVLAQISDITANEDSTVKTVALNLTDVDSVLANATYSVNISDNTLADVSINGKNLIVTPKADKFGSATITVLATLDGKTAQQNFNYTLNSVDDSPILSEISAVLKRSGSGNFSIPLQLSDIDSNVANAKYSVTSSNTNLADVSINGNSIAINPKSGASGTGEITVTATLDGQIVSQTFPISIERVNSAPIIGNIAKISLESDIENQTKTISIPLSDDILVTEFIATSSDSKLVNIISTDKTTGVIEFEVYSNSVGSAIISLNAKDGDGLTANNSFTVEVRANQNQICLENSRVSLSFDTIRGENLDQGYVRKDLYLPTVLSSCDEVVNLSWESSNDKIIDTNGKVYIDEQQDYTVQLIANFSQANYQTKREFLITVPKEETTDKLAIDRAFDLLTFDTIRGENLKRTEIFKNLDLLKDLEINGKKVTISWNSSDSNSLSSEGVILRDLNDFAIKLNAYLIIGAEKREKEFNLIVKGEAVGDSQIVKLDRDWLTISSILNQNRDKNSIMTPLSLHKKGINGGNISWISSTPDIISIDGNISRDNINDRYVELTATISSGEISEKSQFLLKVIKTVIETAENNLTFNRIESNETDGNKRYSLIMDGENNSSVQSNLSISSELKNIETQLSDDMLITKIELSNGSAQVKLNSNGLTESQIEILDENNISVASSINSQVVGVDTQIKQDGSIESSKDNISANLSIDGSVQHVVNSTIANSKLVGSSVTINENKVETKFEKVKNIEDNQYVVNAIIDTDSKN